MQSCARASLPPSRSRAHPAYKFSRAEFQRQHPGGTRIRGYAEDGGFRSATDLGLPIFECRLPICEFPHPAGRPVKVLFKVGNDPWTQRDVKNEGTSGDVYENKEETTKCLVTNSASRTKMHQSGPNREQSAGLLGRRCTDYLIEEDIRRQTVGGGER